MKRRQEMLLRELGLSPIFVRRDVRRAATAASRAGANEPAAKDVSQPVSPAAGKDAPAAKADRRERILKLDWSGLKAAVADCTACSLHAGRTKTVFGVGDERASWLFVGEGPGADEDLQGEPFVGQAGKLLDNMLAAINLKRGDDVYIANIVKCRPPRNRNPEPAEARSCEPYLARQIQLIKPRLIVALGKVAAQNLLDSDAPVTSLRNKVFHYEGIPLIVTYHPAYLLRNLSDKAKAWEDLCFIRENMRGLKSAAA